MQLMCENGVTFMRWFTLSNGLPTGEYVDLTQDGQPYTVTDPLLVTSGACVPVCDPVCFEGVVTDDWTRCVPAIVETCYRRVTSTTAFTPQSMFNTFQQVNGTGAYATLGETVLNNTWVTGAEGDGQYTLRTNSDHTGNGGYGIAFNFGIGSPAVPYVFYTQRLVGTPGQTYQGGFWARERASVKGGWTYEVKDGSTVLATGATGALSNTWTLYTTGDFVMPASGEVTIEISNVVNGSANGNDPVLDDVGLSTVNQTIEYFRKEDASGGITWYDQTGNVITEPADAATLEQIACPLP